MLVIKNKMKFIRGILLIIIVLALAIWGLWLAISSLISIFSEEQDTNINTENENEPKQQTNSISNEATQVSSNVNVSNINANIEVLQQWNLKLVNKDNSVNRDYVPELEEIDDGVMFDKRAISYLKDMINAMYKENITNVWVASAYRTYDRQEELFNNKVQYYKNEGNDQEEAEKLAQMLVQRPEMSEHNLGLAADFNKVDNDFEDTKAFAWLQENAQDYGFILRYPKDKQDITGISYESWHWRYVGAEHAKVIKEKGFCLEEYIEYLKGTEEV